jgi:hypothetical protein
VPLRLADVTSPPVKKTDALAVSPDTVTVICAAPETANLPGEERIPPGVGMTRLLGVGWGIAATPSSSLRAGS